MTLKSSKSRLAGQMNIRVGRARAQTICSAKIYVRTVLSMRHSKLRNSRLWMMQDKNQKSVSLVILPSARKSQPLQTVCKEQPTKRRRHRASSKGPQRNQLATNSLPRLSLTFQRQSEQVNIRTAGARGCNNNHRPPTSRTLHLLGPAESKSPSWIKRIWHAWTSWEP